MWLDLESVRLNCNDSFWFYNSEDGGVSYRPQYLELQYLAVLFEDRQIILLSRSRMSKYSATVIKISRAKSNCPLWLMSEVNATRDV